LTKLEIVTLAESHLEDAAHLVSRRYAALREHAPDLPSRYGDCEVLLPMLEKLVKTGSGVVALSGNELVGFLAAFPIPEFRGLPAVISPEFGNGARLSDSPRIYEAMYAALSPRWVADGRTVHLVVMFANDLAGIDEWHMLGFGKACADAVRDLQLVPGNTADLEIHRAGPADAEALSKLEQALLEHLAAPPTYLVGHEASTQEECARLLADPEYAVWFALQEGDPACEPAGTPVAYLLSGPASENAGTIIRDKSTSSITGAYTHPDARGSGTATALLNRGLAWAKERGYTRCAVDFETMNPQARRFWLRHFTPVTYALERHIDAGAVPKNQQASKTESSEVSV